MADYIKRVDALKAATLAELDADFVIEAIHRIPAADVRPVVRGRWIDLDECSNEGVYCSNCQKKVYKFSYSNTMKRKSNFCPNCGADMREVDDDCRRT